MIERDFIQSQFSIAEARSLIEGSHPAPWLTLVVMATNVLFVRVYVSAHPIHEAIFWQRVCLIFLFSAIFPGTFDSLLRKHFRNQILRNAWAYLDDSFHSAVSGMVDDFRALQAEEESDSGYDNPEMIIDYYFDGLLTELVVFPIAMRPILKAKLKRLPLKTIITDQIRDQTGKIPVCERIHLTLHQRFVQRICPDLSAVLIVLTVFNIAAMAWAW